MHIFNTLILAAGNGTRMNSYIPKPLHKIYGKSIVSMIVDATIKAGSHTNIVIVPLNHSEFKAEFPPDTILIPQKIAAGTGDAVLQAKNIIRNSNTIIIMNGDVPLIKSQTISNLIDSHITNQALLTITTCTIENPYGMGRIIRNSHNIITNIIEEQNATQNQKKISEINAGIYCFNSQWIYDKINKITPSKSGELYLTDLINLAHKENITVNSINPIDKQEIIGVNTKADLAKIQSEVQKNINNKLMLSGVTFIDPNNTYIDQNTKIGKDTVIYPNTYIKGASLIGDNCNIGPSAYIENSNIGNNNNIKFSNVTDSILHNHVSVGPYANIRNNSIIGNNVKIGTSTEIKNSELGYGTKSGHFSYIGDAIIGYNANIGAGTITCNYDGKAKHKTYIGNNAFIGSSTMLVAPVIIGDNVITATGSIINKNIPSNSKAIGSPARIRKNNQ